eukprot:261870_1
MSVSFGLLYYVLSICIQISHEQCTYVRPDLSSTSYVHPTELCSRTTSYSSIGTITYTGTSTKYVCTAYRIQQHTYSNSNCDENAEITNLDTSNIEYNCNGSPYQITGVPAIHPVLQKHYMLKMYVTEQLKPDIKENVLLFVSIRIIHVTNYLIQHLVQPQHIQLPVQL